MESHKYFETVKPEMKGKGSQSMTKETLAVKPEMKGNVEVETLTVKPQDEILAILLDIDENVCDIWFDEYALKTSLSSHVDGGAWALTDHDKTNASVVGFLKDEFQSFAHSYDCCIENTDEGEDTTGLKTKRDSKLDRINHLINETTRRSEEFKAMGFRVNILEPDCVKWSVGETRESKSLVFQMAPSGSCLVRNHAYGTEGFTHEPSEFTTDDVKWSSPTSGSVKRSRFNITEKYGKIVIDNGNSPHNFRVKKTTWNNATDEQKSMFVVRAYERKQRFSDNVGYNDFNDAGWSYKHEMAVYPDTYRVTSHMTRGGYGFATVDDKRVEVQGLSMPDVFKRLQRKVEALK